MATNHHSNPRAPRIGDCTTRSGSRFISVVLHLMRSSPATHPISSREFVSTWMRLPVAESRLVDSAVRVASQIGVVSAVVTKARGRRKIPVFRQPSWHEGLEDKFGTMPDAELARQTGKAIHQVVFARRQLGIPGWVRPGWSDVASWTPENLALLGTIPDVQLGRLMGISLQTVAKVRRSCGIAKCSRLHRWNPEWIALMGTMTDEKLAKQIGRSKESVVARRMKLGIPAFCKQRAWKPEEVAILGTMTDKAAGRLLGRSKGSVAFARHTRGIVGCDHLGQPRGQQ